MFCLPAWAVGSYSSSPPAAEAFGTKSTGGFIKQMCHPVDTVKNTAFIRKFLPTSLPLLCPLCHGSLSECRSFDHNKYVPLLGGLACSRDPWTTRGRRRWPRGRRSPSSTRAAATAAADRGCSAAARAGSRSTRSSPPSLGIMLSPFGFMASTGMPGCVKMR